MDQVSTITVKPIKFAKLWLRPSLAREGTKSHYQLGVTSATGVPGNFEVDSHVLEGGVLFIHGRQRKPDWTASFQNLSDKPKQARCRMTQSGTKSIEIGIKQVRSQYIHDPEWRAYSCDQVVAFDDG